MKSPPSRATIAAGNAFHLSHLVDQDDIRPCERELLRHDVVEGDEILLAYVPGKGTSVSIRGTEKGTVEGKDFTDALFSVWLGANPVQEDLKKALLGS
jgi:hypothetical protein